MLTIDKFLHFVVRLLLRVGNMFLNQMTGCMIFSQHHYTQYLNNRLCQVLDIYAKIGQLRQNQFLCYLYVYHNFHFLY